MTKATISSRPRVSIRAGKRRRAQMRFGSVDALKASVLGLLGVVISLPSRFLLFSSSLFS